MSHRITVRTQINDPEVAEKALKEKGWDYNLRGSTITVTSGPMQSAVINLQTGVVSGDTDFHNEGNLHSLSVLYSELKERKEAERVGGYISDRIEDEEKIILMVSGASLASG